MDHFKFLDRFPTELACIQYFIKTRYRHGITCPHCTSEELLYHRSTRPKNFTCHACGNDFSIFKDTIFENSCTDLRKRQ